MPGKRIRNVSVASTNSSSYYSGSDDEFSTTKNTRRGRGPSKRPCLNRNAMMARVNRQRKKEYVEDLEKKLSHFQEQNRSLHNVVSKQDIDLKRLNAEVSYLKSVLKNNSSITALLQSMNQALSKKKSAKSSLSSPPNIQTIGNNNNFQSLIDGEATCGGGLGEFHTEKIIRNDYFLSQFATEDNSLSPASEFDSGIDMNIIHHESNRLGSFDSDMFGLPSKFIKDEEETIFDNLGEATGVCLHVNSGKISLEYCSVCHLNSIHSDAS